MAMRNAIVTKHLHIEKEIGSLNLLSLIAQDTGILEHSPPPLSSPNPSYPLIFPFPLPSPSLFYLPYSFLILIFIV